ncbi:hypothetical protein NIES4075_41570 [Tolypothrix sp. NIES-4075]|nr:hypothetical protein NIES4075_41570 [Tolypothrix sp. NIES-4075]
MDKIYQQKQPYYRSVEPYILPDGETHKNLHHLQRVRVYDSSSTVGMFLLQLFSAYLDHRFK